MRYLDIAVAVMVGTAAITGLVVWTPAQGDSASASFQERTALRDRMVSFVETRGVTWFVTTPEAEICADVQGAANSTFVLSVQVGSSSCGVPPPEGAVFASISFQLVQSQVTLTAW